MDRPAAARAARLSGAAQVIPCHYDTFPPIETDAQAFKTDVEAAGAGQVVGLAPGATHTPCALGETRMSSAARERGDDDDPRRRPDRGRTRRAVFAGRRACRHRWRSR